MIRYQYIYNQVLQIYRKLDSIEFPIEPSDIIARLPNCRLMTYTKFAKLNGCSVEDVAILCESNSGCTHYDIANDRYLILWNDDRSDNNVSDRRRWTKAHELGHVILNHLPLLTEPKIAEEDEDFFWDEYPSENASRISTATCEQEANVFAATLLCPMPFFEMMEIESPEDIRSVFGLSVAASENRWNEYQKWKRSHVKTAWESNMRKILMQKDPLFHMYKS